MRSFVKRLGTMAFLAAALVFAAPPPAWADFELKIIEDGSVKATFMSATNTVSATNGTYGDFTITGLSYIANRPGGTIGRVSGGTIDVSGTGAHTLTIEVSATDFTKPSGPGGFLGNAVGGTLVSGANITGDATGYVDRGNSIFGTGDVATPTATFDSSTSPSGSFSADTHVGGFNLSIPYSLTQVLDFKTQGSTEFNATSNVTVAVPAPGALVLALTGLPFVGLGWWRRRRTVGVLANA